MFLAARAAAKDFDVIAGKEFECGLGIVGFAHFPRTIAEGESEAGDERFVECDETRKLLSKK